jgi:hypothetical protein
MYHRGYLASHGSLMVHGRYLTRAAVGKQQRQPPHSQYVMYRGGFLVSLLDFSALRGYFSWVTNDLKEVIDK